VTGPVVASRCAQSSECYRGAVYSARIIDVCQNAPSDDEFCPFLQRGRHFPSVRTWACDGARATILISMANENVRDMSKLTLASHEGESGSAPSRTTPSASGTTPRGGQNSEPSPPPGHVPALSVAQELGSQEDTGSHAPSGLPNGHSQPARNFHGLLEEVSGERMECDSLRELR